VKAVLVLAWRYVAHHRVRSLLLAACIALAFLLPLAVQVLVDVYGRALTARAEATPLVAGARGSRYDLVLSSLYFKGRIPDPLSMADADELLDSGLALPVPLLVRRRARGFPVVGTTLDYYAFRGLELAAGDLPLVLGDAVLGAAAARELELGVGDSLLTEQGSLYDLTAGYPLRLRVVGVLADAGSPDDRAVFVDVKTAWIVEGIGHGHRAAETESEDRVLARDDERVVLSAAIVEYTEITPENVDGFHFHGDRADYPLTAILVVPHDAKSATILKGRLRVSPTAQVLVPTEVVDELLGFVLRVKVFFDANTLLVTVATALLVALIVMLTLRLRRRELETLSKLGCARGRVVAILATEWGLVLGAGLAGAAALAAVLVRLAEPWLGWA